MLSPGMTPLPAMRAFATTASRREFLAFRLPSADDARFSACLGHHVADGRLRTPIRCDGANARFLPSPAFSRRFLRNTAAGDFIMRILATFLSFRHIRFGFSFAHNAGKDGFAFIAMLGQRI